jgi:flagellar basal-body rod modification protein FlgD
MNTITSEIAVGPATREPGTPGGPKVRKAQGALDKDDFLKLLVAQLRNQDPQSPASPDQMAAQLAQFTSVEQLTNISKTLESQSTSQATLLNEVAAGAAVGNIGRTITAASDLIDLSGNGNETMLARGNGGPTQMTVYDAATGLQVDQRPIGSLINGTTEINVGRFLQNLTPGVYRVQLSSLDPKAAPGNWTTSVKGVVTGLSTTSNGLQYAMGRLRIPLSSVTEISTR